MKSPAPIAAISMSTDNLIKSYPFNTFFSNGTDWQVAMSPPIFAKIVGYGSSGKNLARIKNKCESDHKQLALGLQRILAF